MLNMDWQDLDFDVPVVAGRRWHRAIDTSVAVAATTSPSPGTSRRSRATRYRVNDRSIVVLISKP